MKFSRVMIILMIILPALLPHSTANIGIITISDQEKVSVLTSSNGVVIIDDIHDNDYSSSDLTKIVDDLIEKNYLPYYASYFANWTEALSFAHYLIIGATYSSISTDDITAIKTWMDSGSKNLLIASRGDFASVNFSDLNDILTQIGANSRVQDDNIYTTRADANREWYIDTSVFNTDYSDLFTGVNNINFFSPSSISNANANEILVYANKESYQTNQTGDPPETVYDDTKDGVGGDSIPIVTLENVTDDRVAVTGSTLWADFDYGDSSADDTVFFGNLMNYFTEQTIASDGSIVIGDIPDYIDPEVKIIYPHDKAVLKGTVTIILDAFDLAGIASYEISIDDNVVATTGEYVWDTTTVSDGDYLVTAKVTDNNGNTASVTHSYTVDQNHVATLNDKPKIMTYNIKESGLYSEWIDVVKEENPDILMLVETGDFDDNNNELLNNYTNLFNEYFFDEIKYESYTLQNIENAWNGITLLSRFPIKDASMINKVTLDDGSSFSVPLPFLTSEIEISDTDTVQIVGAHLTCCTDGFDNRVKEMEGIINYFDTMDKPIIFLGDMNSLSPVDTSDTTGLGIEPIKMLITSNHVKSSVKHTFIDAHTKLNPSDQGYTYKGYSRIDYIFVNQYFFDMLISSTTGDSASAEMGSDHVPVDLIIDLTKDFPVFPNDTLPSSNAETPSINFIQAFSVLMVTLVIRKKIINK